MSRKARKNVGVIGLGIIGTRVAAGLRAAGFQAYVWNRSARPAPNFLGSPAEVADAAEVIQIFVADSAALFEVIESMGEMLTARHVVVCCSTVGPEAVLEAARTVQAAGAQFLDAPFTGSKLAAEKRQLIYYVGGAESAFLKAKPVLEVTSRAIVRMGEIGHASTVKVVTNMISAVSVQVLAEALSIVQKAGLETELLAAAIEQNACRSGVIDLKLPKMMAGDYEPHFSLKHMFKDVQLGIHMANALDIEIPATTVTAGVMHGALNQGWGDLDFSSLYKNYALPEDAADLPALPPAPQPEPAAVEAEELAGELATPKAEPLEAKRAGATEIAAPLAAETPAVRREEGSPGRVFNPDAARIIEAVLARASGHGSTPAAPVESSGSAETPAESREPADSLLTRPNAALATEPPRDEEEPAVRPINFVRRWFVARNGG